MKKIIVLGDIHGRTCWKEIVNKEQDADLFIFLGDYVSTHENISEREQVENLREILDFKEENSDKVILLRGNHDMQHLGYRWAECSGLFYNVQKWMSLPEVQKRFLSDTQWIHQIDNIIFSHAGVSEVWLENIRVPFEIINELEPSEIFAFTPDTPWGDMTGTSRTQPITWIRPQTLANCMYETYTQVVGHTPVYHIVDATDNCVRNNHLWLCDALPYEYLKIYKNNEDEEFIFEVQKLAERKDW